MAAYPSKKERVMNVTEPWLFPRPKSLRLDGRGRLACRAQPAVTHRPVAGLPPEGYTLEVGPDGIDIGHGGPAGAFYAELTLGQLLRQYGTGLPFLRIEDEPDFAKRGVLLDIGRNKIPTMDGLFALVDMLAALKLNQLHLYMEGYCFEYEAHKANFPGETPISADEYRRLDAYAKERFVELVPTQNCFGHMGPWLARDAYKDLAERPEGFELIPGLWNPPSVLDPADPRSLELVAGLFDELLPNFGSPHANICFDEPFELGLGKSASACAEKGVGAVYLSFLEKVCAALARHGKRPMIWGDFVAAHPETLEALPTDIVILDWNYEASVPFEPHCRALRDRGLSFYVCPGTGSCCSIAGRVSNMKANLMDAAEQGLRYGAEGFLVTDWGDMGHWQPPAIAYPGYAYGAALSWNLEGNRDADIARYLDEYVFEDEAGLMGQAALDLGDYSRFEGLRMPTATALFGLLALIGPCGKDELEAHLGGYMAAMGQARPEPGALSRFDIEGLRGLLSLSAERVGRARMRSSDAALIADEYMGAIGLLSHGVDLMEFALGQDGLSRRDKESALRRLADRLREIIKAFEGTWMARNRAGGLDRSVERFRRLLGRYEELLAAL